MTWAKWDDFEQSFVEGFLRAWGLAGRLLILPFLFPFALVYLVRQIIKRWSKP